MPELSTNILNLLQQLLPGFLAAWIFYGLTGHPKKPTFERVIEALLYTVVIQTIVILIRQKIFWGRWIYDMGLSSQDAQLVWSVCIAVLVGLLVSILANYDLPHRLLRRCLITVKYSAPSEWFYCFSSKKRNVVLTLSGERRLFGWPKVWPDQPGVGHFVIESPEWVGEDGKRYPMPKIDVILIPASEVIWVEFEKRRSEIGDSDEEVIRQHQELVSLQKENINGKQDTKS